MMNQDTAEEIARIRDEIKKLLRYKAGRMGMFTLTGQGDFIRFDDVMHVFSLWIGEDSE